jgi:hypothetical protein
VIDGGLRCKIRVRLDSGLSWCKAWRLVEARLEANASMFVLKVEETQDVWAE